MKPEVEPKTWGCCDTEGEICCGSDCPCPDSSLGHGGTQIEYVEVGTFDFTKLTGEKAIWVSLVYAERRGQWTCSPKVVIRDVDAGPPKIKEIRRPPTD